MAALSAAAGSRSKRFRAAASCCVAPHGRTRKARFWTVSVVNLTFRQRHLKVTDACASDVGSGQFKRSKINQSLEMHQASIGDFGSREIQISELSQLFELY